MRIGRDPSVSWYSLREAFPSFDPIWARPTTSTWRLSSFGPTIVAPWVLHREGLQSSNMGDRAAPSIGLYTVF